MNSKRMNKPQRFSKKPVVIEAIQWTGENLEAVLLFGCGLVSITNLLPSQMLLVHIMEGNMILRVGAWLIKEVEGEFYPCDPDIFEATYQAVEAGQKP